MTASNSTPEQVKNGVNVDALLGAREALEKAPEAAQFKWRASCEWLNGTHSRSKIGGFFGLGAEQSRDKTFTVEADHPKVFASEDHAPTPVELVLSGLASCLTAGVAAIAQRRGPRPLRHPCRRQRGRHQGAGRAIAEAVRRLRHHHQSDRRLRHGQLMADGEEERVS